MRNLIIFFAVVLSLQLSHASEELELSFNYEETSHVKNPEGKAEVVGSLFKTLGSENFAGGEIKAPFFVDSVHTSPDADQAVMMKYGFEVSDPGLRNKILKTPFGYLFHTQTSSGAPYALYFRGFEKEKVMNHLYDMRYTSEVKPSRKSFHLTELILSSAHAQECEPTLTGIVKYASEKTKLEAQKSLGCLVGIFKGAWDTTGSAIGQPIQASTAVWAGANKFTDGLQAFEKDVLRSMKTPGNKSSISEAKLTAIKCRIGSALGKEALITYFKTGMSSPANLLKIAKSLEEMKSLYKN